MKSAGSHRPIMPHPPPPCNIFQQMKSWLGTQIHINHHTNRSAKADGQHKLLIRAEPVTALGMEGEGLENGGWWWGGDEEEEAVGRVGLFEGERTGYENCVVVLCTSLWEFLNKPIWW